MGALSGVRVLDLSRVLAGPWCTQCMADLGAEVWKIEPLWGDETRAWGPPFDDSTGQSSYFRCTNRGKASLAVDLKRSEGAQLVRSLASKADVLVENYKVGDLARFGLGHADLLESCPRLVYVSITGFGQTGPRASEPGYDAALQGRVGIMSLTGDPEGPPQKVGVAWVDLLTAYATLAGALAALRHRDQTGQGQHVDMSLFDVGLTAMANLAQATLTTGLEPRRLGNNHAQIVPYGAFLAEDGWFMLAVGNDRQFERLCAILGQPDWSTGEWASNERRVEHRDAVVSAISGVLIARKREVWIAALMAEGIPCSPVNSLGEALADPQTEARGLIKEGLLCGPFGALSATPAEHATWTPDLGQGGEWLLANVLGITQQEIERLNSEGVIRTQAYNSG